MAEIPKDIKFLLFGMGAKWHATVAFVLDLLGMAILIVAIVASATDQKLGLETIYWFILAPTIWIWGLWSWFTALNAAKEG
jgi:hypothetical protein